MISERSYGAVCDRGLARLLCECRPTAPMGWPCVVFRLVLFAVSYVRAVRVGVRPTHCSHDRISARLCGLRLQNHTRSVASLGKTICSLARLGNHPSALSAFWQTILQDGEVMSRR